MLLIMVDGACKNYVPARGILMLGLQTRASTICILYFNVYVGN